MARTGGTKGRPKKPHGKGTLPLPEDITAEDLEGIPSPPPHLMEDGATLWYKLLAYGKAFTTPADSILIAETCEIFEEKEFLRRKITVEGKRTYNYKGQELPTPYVAQLKNSRAEFHAKLAALGFTPTDRAKLNIEISDANDPFEALVRAKLQRAGLLEEDELDGMEDEDDETEDGTE